MAVTMVEDEIDYESLPSNAGLAVRSVILFYCPLPTRFLGPHACWRPRMELGSLIQILTECHLGWHL